MPFSDVPAAAEEQAGTFTRAQAYAGGWTPRQVRRRLGAGRWKVVAGDALVTVDTAIGPAQLAHAVTLTWPAAVVSHELAGALYEFPIEFDGVGTATVPQTSSVRANALQAHRLPLTAQDVGRHGRVLITTRQRTGLDLLRSQSWPRCRSLWAWLSTRRVLCLADIEAELTRPERRVGSGQLRRLIAVSASGSLSAAEDLLHELLRCALITGWRANVPVEIHGRTIAVADVLFDAARIVIEVDGYAAHSSPEAFQRDRERQNLLVGAGFRVLRFTWTDLSQRPQNVITRIASALASDPPNWVSWQRGGARDQRGGT